MPDPIKSSDLPHRLDVIDKRIDEVFQFLSERITALETKAKEWEAKVHNAGIR